MPKCQYCKMEVEKLTKDHLIPKAFFKRKKISSPYIQRIITYTCVSCNSRKQDLSIFECFCLGYITEQNFLYVFNKMSKNKVLINQKPILDMFLEFNFNTDHIQSESVFYKKNLCKKSKSPKLNLINETKNQFLYKVEELFKQRSLLNKIKKQLIFID